MKHACTFLLIALLSIALSGCAPQETDDRIEITFWHSFVQSTIPALEELIERFEAEHPDLRIRAQYIPTGDALVQKLVTSVQTGTAPDISWVRSFYMEDLVQADAVYPMNTFINGPDGLTEADLAAIYPVMLQYASWQGTLYSLPMEATNLGILYNKDHFREAGLDPERPPATWDELREAALRLSKDENGDGRAERVGFFVPAVPADGPQGPYMMWQWTPFLWQAGGYLINEEQTRVLFAERPGVQALTLWKDLYEAQQQRNFTNDELTAFASEQASMILDGPWNLPRYPRLLGHIDWGIAAMPEGPVKRATVVAGEYLAIFKQSEHPEAAWTFVKWIVQPEIQAFWSQASGYLPIRADVLDVESYQAFLAEHPGHRAFVDQMAFAQAQRPMDFFGVEIQRELAVALEKATVGGVDPAAALGEAAEKSNRLLDRAERPEANARADSTAL